MKVSFCNKYTLGKLDLLAITHQPFIVFKLHSVSELRHIQFTQIFRVQAKIASTLRINWQALSFQASLFKYSQGEMNSTLQQVLRKLELDPGSIRGREVQRIKTHFYSY